IKHQKRAMNYNNFNKMYEELKNAGYPDINDFNTGNEYNNALKSVSIGFDNFIKIVSKWLPKLEYKAGGVILLTETNQKYDGRVITSIFKETSNQEKWRICDAITRNPPLNINDWVKETYLDKQYGY